MVSDQTKYRISEAYKNQNNYTPNEEILRSLNERAIVMVVAPAAMGKSTLISRVAEFDSDFKKISEFTTRERREGDDRDVWRYIPYDDEHVNTLLDAIDRREIVQYAVHPTTRHIYGTYVEDFQGRYGMLATLADAVEQMQKLPWRVPARVIGIATDPNSWQNWFEQRYPVRNDEKLKRLSETLTSLRWLLRQEQGTITWIFNRPDHIDETARDFIKAIKENTPGSEKARVYAEQILQMAEKMQQDDVRGGLKLG